MEIKLFGFCEECLSVKIKERKSIPREDVFVPLILQNNLVYDVECDKGHKSKVIINAPKYELLFELGIESLKQGNYSGATTYFKSALEPPLF
jgi:hypothetical protein